MSLLAIDIGNSNIHLGWFQGHEVREQWRLQTSPGRTADEHGVILLQLLARATLPCPDGIVLSSVAAASPLSVLDACRNYLGREPVQVFTTSLLGLAVKCEPVSAVGVDRIINAVAAVVLYGAPCIVVDFGTATTVDAIDSEGVFLGGAIAPGVWTGLDGLRSRAPRLPAVELSAPASPIGSDTVSALQSGAVFGHAGLVDGLVARYRQLMGGVVPVVATGGLAALFSGVAESIGRTDPLLTLQGLRICWERLAADA